jgi:hypothetical protein
VTGSHALLVDLDDTLLEYSTGVDASWEGACAAIAGRPAWTWPRS